MSDGTAKRERPLTIKEERQRSSESSAWENWDRPPIVRFQISDNDPNVCIYWVGVPFSSVISTECIERGEGAHELGIEWKDDKKIRNLFITGPKVPELFIQFCLNVVSVVRADGKDITRVALLAPKETE